MKNLPIHLDSIIIFAPSGKFVPSALKAVHKGGIVVSAGDSTTSNELRRMPLL